MSGMLPGLPLARSAPATASPGSLARPALRPNPSPNSSASAAASAASAHRFAGACRLLQAAVVAVPICKGLKRRPRGGAAGARDSSAVASAARRNQTEDRLRELETLVGDDEDVSSIDEVTAALEPTAVPASANAARFRDLPQELPRAIPFLPEPAYRAFAANVAGDVGFDPLGFCTDVEKFIDYREAELKHGRLAMIAALVFPLAEEAALKISDENGDLAGIPDLLAESGGRALPVITGGIGDEFIESFIGLTLLFGAAFELTARRRGTEPGDVGFDPLKIKGYQPPPFVQSFLPRNRQWMAEAEVQHCRIGMLAIAYDIIDEVTTGNPVIEDTEYWFYQADERFLAFENALPFGAPSIPESLLTGEFPAQL